MKMIENTRTANKLTSRRVYDDTSLSVWWRSTINKNGYYLKKKICWSDTSVSSHRCAEYNTNTKINSKECLYLRMLSDTAGKPKWLTLTLNWFGEYTMVNFFLKIILQKLKTLPGCIGPLYTDTRLMTSCQICLPPCSFHPERHSNPQLSVPLADSFSS